VPVNCAHHIPHYNPWHRVFVDKFEQTLQAQDGFKDIKLPYWDILAPIPEWFFKPPFDSYVLQAAAGPYAKGTATQRYPRAQLQQRLLDENVPEDIRKAMNSPQFASFNEHIERAHDGGHTACGYSMGTPDIAAYDPIFWLFHCNWERMWWAWQMRYDAIDLAGFRKTLDGPADWLDDPVINGLDPFGRTADETIDISAYDYEDDGHELFDSRAVVASGSLEAGRLFTLQVDPKVSILVKGIERLGIAGSFQVYLFGDGEEIAHRSFFQSSTPEVCPSCAKNAKVNIGFELDRSAIAGKTLEIRVRRTADERGDSWLDPSEIGSPTVNVRDLLISK
jgi:hypothetical protein